MAVIATTFTTVFLCILAFTMGAGPFGVDEDLKVFSFQRQVPIAEISPAPPLVIDGRIGICPRGVITPLITCMCTAIFKKTVRFKEPPNKTVKMLCLGVLGSKKEILAQEDFCIPYLNKKGKLRVKKLVKDFNFVLTGCKTNTISVE